MVETSKLNTKFSALGMNQLFAEQAGRQEQFSLSAFERAAGVRFGVATDKPKVYFTFFDELKAEAGL